MKHSVYGKRLSRTKNQRTSLFRGLVRSLILNGSITTTQTKAGAIKGLVDTLIVDGKKKTPATLANLESFIIWPEIREKLLTEISPSYKQRTSGFTSVVKLGRRQGDRAMMVKMSLIKDNELSESSNSVVSKTVKLKTEKPKSENRKPKTDNGDTK